MKKILAAIVTVLFLSAGMAWAVGPSETIFNVTPAKAPTQTVFSNIITSYTVANSPIINMQNYNGGELDIYSTGAVNGCNAGNAVYNIAVYGSSSASGPFTSLNLLGSTYSGYTAIPNFQTAANSVNSSLIFKDLRTTYLMFVPTASANNCPVNIYFTPTYQ